MMTDMDDENSNAIKPQLSLSQLTNTNDTNKFDILMQGFTARELLSYQNYSNIARLSPSPVGGPTPNASNYNNNNNTPIASTTCGTLTKSLQFLHMQTQTSGDEENVLSGMEVQKVK